jgi:uncharacterized protein (TIGR02145 family)
VFKGLTSEPISLGDGTKISAFDNTELYDDVATPNDGTAIPIYYGVRIANTTKPGAYHMINNGTIVYHMVMDGACINYTLSYDKNNEDATGTMNDQLVPVGNETALTANNFTREGYTFKEWNTEPDGTGDSFADEEPVTDITDPNTTLNLFAIWEANTYNITIKTVAGISSVTIAHGADTVCTTDNTTGTNCELTYDEDYIVTAVLSTGYTFNNWVNSENIGTIDDDTATTITYSPGLGDTELIPDTSPISYPQTTEVRYENADGTWGNYATVDTKSVDYDSTYSWSTSELSGFDSTVYQSASVASYTVTGAHTNQISIYRKTFTVTKQYRAQDTSGGYPSSYTPDGSVSVRYGGSYTYNIPATTTHQAASKTASNVTANTTLSVDVPRKTYTVTKQYRLQDTSGNYPSSYTSGGTQTVVYGGSYTYSIAATTTNQAASNSVSNVTSNTTVSVDVPRKTYTCTKQYRLQGADGNYPSSYTNDGSATAYHGGSCSYTKSYTNYTSQTASASNVTSNQTLSVSLPRTTYTLTVNKGSNISSVSGGGTYRWGQTVTVSATKSSNVTCTSYGTPTWSRTSGSGTLNATSGASVTFTMTTSNATVTATSSASSVAQTVTLSKGTGVSSIKIGSTNYSGTSVSLNCGTYNISGNYSSGYEFSSWARANNVTVASTSSASTTMTVSGAGTLTLNGKALKTIANSTTMQEVNSCPASLTTGQVYTIKDSRDNTEYHTAKLADGNCWMLDNLALDLVTHKNDLSSANTNASDTTLNYLRNGGGSTSNQYATAGVSNWTSSYSYSAPLVNITNKDVVPTSSLYGGTDDPMKDKVVAGNWKVGGYYNFCAASAGSYCYGNGTDSGTSSGNATEDICPKGWRLPTSNTSGEYPALAKAIYGSTGSTSDSTAYANYRSALRLPLSGYFYNGSAYGHGSYGGWWSSTHYTNNSMYRLYANTSDINPAYGNDRRNGSSVRCVLGS